MNIRFKTLVNVIQTDSLEPMETAEIADSFSADITTIVNNNDSNPETSNSVVRFLNTFATVLVLAAETMYSYYSRVVNHVTTRLSFMTTSTNESKVLLKKNRPVSPNIADKVLMLSRTLFNGAPNPVVENYPPSPSNLEALLVWLDDTLRGTGFIKAVNMLRKYNSDLLLVPVNKRWIQVIPEDVIVISVNVMDKIWDESVGPTDNTIITSVYRPTK